VSAPPAPESVFTYGAPALKFGDGASDEIGYDLAQLGARRALVVTDPGVAATGLPDRVAAQMAQFGVEAVVFDAVHIEPTDASMQAAIDWARANGPWDALVAVGGGSSIDTAKALKGSQKRLFMARTVKAMANARNPSFSSPPAMVM